ncbi:M1 family metallopeptidase [Serpentinicella sp. ANB-PHB4]|uniref:M1 family metallopeptidase n=1 Tax=Serpentinicella sp. ANB-PHB4 TaxID=3074076 RepID=UPI0028580911|nr:M1 family metallopeptidase [Serpentinicella sp. ANB-PHB4]MDR5658874.1 M1 family metallopeptidase [Serpentinicella sp. ANB-PHB4]
MLLRKLKLFAVVLTVMMVSIVVQYMIGVPVEQPVFSTNFDTQGTIYNMDITFIEDKMSLKGSQQVLFTNNTGRELENIYFHLYPNIFKCESTAPFEKTDMDRAYPRGFDPGYIQINSVEKNNSRATYKVMGDDDALLRVTLKEPIKPNKQVTLSIKYKVRLPFSMGRMGYGKNTVNMANFFPILSVYDHNGWNLDPYYPIGDPFYSDISNYRVKVSLPKTYTLATTGNVMNQQERKGNIVYDIEAEQVRNFAMVASERFDVRSAKASERTTVKSYTIEGIKAEQALQYGVDAITIFNQMIGIYPYEQLSIAASDFFIGGMEYPNLVIIGKHLYDRDEDFPLEYVIVHEVAHQWWYGLVGNNEVKEPWIDEALTEYTTLLYFEKKYGEHIKEQIYEKMTKNQFENYQDITKNSNDSILRSLDEFDNSFEYSSVVYSRGAMFIEALRNEIGDADFFSALRSYYETFKFKNVTTKDFYNVFQQSTDKDLKVLFEEWLETTIE